MQQQGQRVGRLVGVGFGITRGGARGRGSVWMMRRYTTEKEVEERVTMPVRVRFAPSPTGQLHLGSLRTALFNHLFAKSTRGAYESTNRTVVEEGKEKKKKIVRINYTGPGKSILRIEDTDQARRVEGAEEKLTQVLSWCGIDFDEGPVDLLPSCSAAADKGPYRQSERLEVYQKFGRRILERGGAYRCFCSPATLNEMRKQQRAHGQPTRYDRRCAQLTEEQVQENLQKGMSYVVRLKIPTSGYTLMEDAVHGKIRFENVLLDDQILIKADGFPTYHLANVVDDYLMGVTHVIRGEEWVSSTPKHILIYQLLGIPARFVPVFVHLPLLLRDADGGGGGGKLSKRHKDSFVEYFRERGYLPQALVNFVAFLGWNLAQEEEEEEGGEDQQAVRLKGGGGSNSEKLMMDDIKQLFGVEGFNKSAPRVSMEKLRWMNKQHMMDLFKDVDIFNLSPDCVVGDGVDVKNGKADISYCVAMLRKCCLETFKNEQRLEWNMTDSYLVKVLKVSSPRLWTIAEIPEEYSFFWNRPVVDSELLDRVKRAHSNPIGLLELAKRHLQSSDSLQWSANSFAFSDWVATVTKELGVKKTSVMLTIRLVLTGQKSGPNVGELASVLPREECLARVDNFINLSSKQ